MDQVEFDAVVERLRRQQTDDATVEVKASAQDLGKSLWDSISAFANTSGGLLVLGLDEQAGFVPARGFDIDRMCNALIDGLGDGSINGKRLFAPPKYTVSRFSVDGAAVLAVEISENEVTQKPCYVLAKGAIGGAFRRVDDKDVRLSATEVREMQNVLTPSESDRELVPSATPADLMSEAVDALIAENRDHRILHGVPEGVAGREQALQRLNVTDGNGALRLAGLLVLGHAPQTYFPRLIVDVAVHPSEAKADPAAPERFSDRQECFGPIADMVSEAVSVVRRNLRTATVVDGVAGTARIEVPLEVLREAIVNAVVHRQYEAAFRGQAVVVDVFPSRIVVTSPGGLWGGKTPETLADGVSKCRNQTLVQLLRFSPSSIRPGQLVEGQGSGIPHMMQQMRNSGLPEPKFIVKADQFTVELRRPDVQDSAPQLPSSAGNLAQVSDGRRRPLGETPGFGPLEGALLLALQGQEALGVHELAAKVSRPVNSVRPALRHLIAVGAVEATAPPTSRNRRYRLPDGRRGG